MNTENLDKLINHLTKAPAKAFNMERWIRGGPLDGGYFGGGEILPDAVAALQVVKAQEDPNDHNCGTVMCLAGHAVALAMAEEDTATLKQLAADQGWPLRAAANWLGLTFDMASKLFVPATAEKMTHVTKAQAIRVLKNLKKTGRVAWAKAGVTFSPR